MLKEMRDIQQGHLPDVTHYCSETTSSPSHLSLQALLSCSNSHGDTPFLVAARHGHVTLLRALHEEHGVPLEHRNTDGKTALHEAAQSGQHHCIRYLTSQGAAIDPLKMADWTPLMLACTKDDAGVVELLVRAGASLRLTNKDGWTPLHIACRQGNPDIVGFLLDTEPGCWDTISKNGRTPLHTAALHGRLEVIQLLQQRCGYSADAADSCGVRPLMDAARANHVTVIEYLLDVCGASLDEEDVLGRRGLHHAAQAGAGQAIECLVARGAVVNQGASVNSITPLHYAAKEGQATAIAVLLKCGADPSLTDKRGRTALDLARRARNSEKAVKLLEQVTS